jgi:ribonuclease R
VCSSDLRASACVMRIRRTGEIISSEIFRCFIINKRRLNYREAQEILDGKQHAETWLTQSLKTMSGLAEVLRKRRLFEGSLEFDLPEVKIDFKGGRIPAAIKPYEKFSTNRMIEEFMLLANQVVAGRLTDMDRGAIYRIHGSPEDKAVENLYNFIRTVGLKAPVFEGLRSLKGILEIASGTPFEKPVHMMVLRAMPKAKYSARNIGHFGLAFELYTHFTSPIRRYPDLLVHRLLFHSPDRNRKRPLSPADLEKISEQCSQTEEKAMKAERDAVSLCACMVLHSRKGEEFDGTVSGVIEAGVFVELKGLGVDGMIHVSRLGNDYYSFDAGSLSMIGRNNGHRISLGQSIRVKILDVGIALRRIDLVSVEPAEREA